MGSSGCLARSPNLIGHVPDLKFPYKIYGNLTPRPLKRHHHRKTDWVPNMTDWVGWAATQSSKKHDRRQHLNLRWADRFPIIWMGAKPPTRCGVTQLGRDDGWHFQDRWVLNPQADDLSNPNWEMMCGTSKIRSLTSKTSVSVQIVVG